MDEQVDVASRSMQVQDNVHLDPYPHIHLSPQLLGLGRDAIEPLVETYPHTLMTRSTRSSGSDKTYSVELLDVKRRGTEVEPRPPLSAEWRDFLDRATDPRRIRAVTDGLGIEPDVAGDMDVRLMSYRAGGWMTRHTDRPDKYVTILWYLNPDWDGTWGGKIGLYPDESGQSPVCEISPGPLNGIAFARSDTSWHEVASVEDHAQQPRRVLMIQIFA